MRWVFNRVFWAVLLFSASSFSGFAHAKRAASKHAAPLAAEDCKKDSDCSIVIDDCCSCSQGGSRRAVPKKEKLTYEKDRKKRCAGTMCVATMSQHPSCTQHAFCGAGICEMGDLTAPKQGKMKGKKK